MSEEPITGVLIVGAGPVGLTLASDLARRGIACRIIDQETRYHTGRAAGLSSRTQEIFADLGLLPQIAPYNAPIPWRFYDRANHVVREIDPAALPLAPTPDIPYPGTLQMSQQDIETVLRASLASSAIPVELDCRLIDITQHLDHITATVVRTGRSEDIQARYVVGCDGGHSTVRALAGMTFAGETQPNAYTVAGVIHVHGLAPTYRHIWRDRDDGFQVSLTPRMQDGTWNMVMGGSWTESPPATLEVLQHLFDDHIGMPDVLFSEPSWLSVHQVNKRLVDRYRRHRVVLAGDAAHVGLFFGMQTGIQDAYNLGWKLALVLQGAPDALLDTYQEERLPIAQADLAAGGVETGVQAVTKAILNTETSSLAHAPPAVPNALILTQLGITYRGRSLALDLDDLCGIRAGDRAPDAPCRRITTGDPVRLFDLFQGTHFTLLVFSKHPVLSALDHVNGLVRPSVIMPVGSINGVSDNTLVDDEAHAAQAYGVMGDAQILVRPDGYIGVTQGSHDPHAIRSYLHTMTGYERTV